MNIVSIGGGPAGLFFSILARLALPDSRVRVFERDRKDDTFGWGVVFSDETLDNVARAEPETYRRITEAFIHWDRIDTFVEGALVQSTGHGFCGLSRKKLLRLLRERAEELGVEITYEHSVEDPSVFSDADLILAADGVNSTIRNARPEVFRPRLDWRHCRFAWLGTDLELPAFTFIFKENEHGLWHVHAYPFEPGRSTWIVECHEDTFQKAGLDVEDEAATVAYCEKLFADELQGHRLLANRSIWRRFPTVHCERWHDGNLVLMGDAVHTAHFSIGSGTKLAMEDAIALMESIEATGKDPERISEALDRYHDQRRVEVLKTQKAAQTSLEWFEESLPKMQDDPLQFTFSLMTRSKRITYENLGERDPDLVARTRDAFARGARAPEGTPPAFTPYRVGALELANRIVVSPMCQYMARDGMPDDWHLVHLGSRAVGGAGLIITEMTNVSAEARITPGCTGIWNDEQEASWKRIVDYVHAHSAARIGLQLGHAGRKASCEHPWEGADKPLAIEDGGWPIIGPTTEPHVSGWPEPRAMTREDMDAVLSDFVNATERTARAGFDLIEVHMAHGYLLSTFLSPASNTRDDAYGGSTANRVRFPLEVLRAVRAAWPADRPVAVRISASDWMEEGGMTPEESVAVSRLLAEAGADLIDVSSGGVVSDVVPTYGRMYQVPFAEKIKRETGIPVMAVGAIQGIDHANTVLASGRADLCALARPHLWNPYLTAHAAHEAGLDDENWPGPYRLGRPRLS